MLKFFTQYSKFSNYVGSTSPVKLLEAVKFLNHKLQVVQNTLPNGMDNSVTFSFNCWNFTAWLKGWTKQVYWYDYTEMLAHLRNHSLTERPKVGDVVAWFDCGHLTHTAIIIELAPNNNHIVIQKSGPQPMVIERIKNTSYSRRAKYRFYTA